MSADYLTQNERTRLLDLLFDNNVTLDGAEKKFKELFPVARFPVAAKQIKSMTRDLIFSCDGPALITALYVVDVMRRADCEPAKAVLFDTLVELEKAIRRDMFLQEQIKYASKEVKEGRKSIDAVHAEELRVHCVAKVFVLDLLGGKTVGDTKPCARLAIKQDAVDSALDVWEKSHMLIKEPLADVTYSWTSDREKQRCGVPLESGAIFDNTQPQRLSAVTMKTAPVKAPSVPVSAGELQFLLPGQKNVLLLDSQAPSSEWDIAKRLLDSVASGVFSLTDKDTLITSLTDSVIKHIDFNDKLICGMATHSPDVCAAVLSKLPAVTASSFIQSLITGKASKANVASVLVNAPKSIEQVNMRTFIAESLRELQESSSDQESAKTFFTCLHQLVTVFSKENNELYIADAVKPDLEKLVKAVDIPEVTSKWEEMKA